MCVRGRGEEGGSSCALIEWFVYMVDSQYNFVAQLQSESLSSRCKIRVHVRFMHTAVLLPKKAVG